LAEKEKELKRKIKTAEKKLDNDLLAKYHSLKESEIMEIVIHDKWLSSIYHSTNEEMDRIYHNLAGRVRELVERYETPLPNLSNDVKELTAKVDQHLKKMGFRW